MLDRARPELIQSDQLRGSALEPRIATAKPRRRITFNWKMPLAAFLFVEFLVALTPEMAEMPTPLAIDIAGYAFAYGMLALTMSIIVPTRWSALGGVGLGALGLALHAQCGLGGHVPMTAGWYMATAALMAGFIGVSGFLAAKSRTA